MAVTKTSEGCPGLQAGEESGPHIAELKNISIRTACFRSYPITHAIMEQ